MIPATEITAPTLLAMNTRGARGLAAALVVAMAISVTSALDDAGAWPLLTLSMGIAALGVVGVVIVQEDPMPVPAAAMVAATGPLACTLTCLAVRHPALNPNETNVLGVGVAVCAFLCVRGRTVMAWMAMTTMIATFAAWSQLTGQGVLVGVALAGPNAAVLGMATLFAVVMRPAATTIRQLRAASITQAETIAASTARQAEGNRQRAELQELAWPILTRIAAAQHFSFDHVHDIRLTEAQLRDGVRARSLKVPSVIAAARAARARGVGVVMFDDGALDDAYGSVRERLCDLACEWMDRTDRGVITLRVHPPGRPVLASVVVEHPDGTSQRTDLEVDPADTAT